MDNELQKSTSEPAARNRDKEEQLLKQIEKVNKELKDFAYIVSHDLKAPLRGIKTIVDWISKDYADKLDEEGKEQMEMLVGRVDRMHNLIDGVLQYSRATHAEEAPREIDLNELMPSILNTIDPPENIEINVEGKLPVTWCKETGIRQVFQNLLDNAIKYMDKPKGQIKVGCAEEEDFWKFYVSDNGPGIQERDFERVFGMFQTLKRRDEFESTGVGLTLVKKIVEMNNGRIWIESKVGEGSTFYFTLPKKKQGVKNEEFQTNNAC